MNALCFVAIGALFAVPRNLNAYFSLVEIGETLSNFARCAEFEKSVDN